MLMKIKPGGDENQKKILNLRKIRKSLTDIIRKNMTNIFAGFFDFYPGGKDGDRNTIDKVT
jgi:hypothetical protein